MSYFVKEAVLFFLQGTSSTTHFFFSVRAGWWICKDSVRSKTFC